MNQNFDQKLLTKIKDEKISPRPRWQFLLKKYVIASAGILAVLIGAASFSVLVYLFKFNDFEIYEATHKTLAQFIVLTLPYFWIIFLGLFILITYYNIKHTKRGYRHPVYLIILSSIAASLILGSVFFFLGWGAKVDGILGRRAPFYHEVFNPQLAFWSNPGEGRLIGIVAEKNIDGSFIIIEPSGISWRIELPASSTVLSDPSLDIVNVGQPLRLIGRVSAEGKFSASMIRPMGPGRDFLKKHFNENGPRRLEDRPDCRPGICPALPSDMSPSSSRELLDDNILQKKNKN